MSTSALRESAIAVFREATWAAKAIRGIKRREAITKSTKAFAALFRRQGKLVADQLLPRVANLFVVREVSYEPDLIESFAEIFGATKEQAEKAMFDVLFDGVMQGYDDLTGDFGLETAFKVRPEQATEWARANAATKVSSIDATTEKTIRDMITTGINEGKSYSEVAREIKGRFEDFAEGRPQAHIRSRAEIVAVQENAMAYEAGQAQLVEEIQAVGITMEKAIVGPLDGNTSQICQDALEMGWVSMDTEFPGGSMTAPLHVACRHSTAYRVKED